MDPSRTYLQTLLATERAWRHLANGFGMDAFVGHQCLLALAGSAALSPSSARKGVQLGNYLCALSDGSGNALDRTRAHITHREYARQVGFERSVDVSAGAHEPLVIDHHARP